MAFANLARGVPIDANMQFTGNLLTLLNPYGLLGGLTAVGIFLLHGSLFLGLKTTGELKSRAETLARRLWLPALLLASLLLVATWFFTDFVAHRGAAWIVVPLAGLVSLALAGVFSRRQRTGWGFTMTGLSILFSLATFFLLVYPRVMISSTAEAFSLTIENAAPPPLHPGRDEHRGGSLCADRAGVSGVYLLGFPQAGYLGEERPGLLIPNVGTAGADPHRRSLFLPGQSMPSSWCGIPALQMLLFQGTPWSKMTANRCRKEHHG